MPNRVIVALVTVSPVRIVSPRVCDHQPVIDRRALLMAGAGVTTYAAAATYEPATAAPGKPTTRTHTFTGTFTGVGTPDWHYLPFR